ncbi:antibiotic biosynthesis monooxygenase (plasmid) [Arthrobacter sp. D3-18]
MDEGESAVIYEHAYLKIAAERANEFESAFYGIQHELTNAPGCRSVELVRSIDGPETYLLKVGWRHIEDHTDIFPTTDNAKRFAHAIAGFFEGEPLVLHFPG